MEHGNHAVKRSTFFFASSKSNSTSSLSCISMLHNEDPRKIKQLPDVMAAELIKLKKYAASMEGNLTLTKSELTTLQVY